MKPWIKKFYIATMIMVLVLVLFVGMKLATIPPMFSNSFWIPHRPSSGPIMEVYTNRPRLGNCPWTPYISTGPIEVPIRRALNLAVPFTVKFGNETYYVLHEPKRYLGRERYIYLPSRFTRICQRATLSPLGYGVGIILHSLTLLCLCTLFLLEEHWYENPAL